MSESSGEKKIIIDEDWKSQVEAEREELAKPDRSETKPARAAEPTMPPASFEMLITTLATEAMVALGQIPHPATGKLERNLEPARYFIDTLSMLETKTEGNLSPEETQMLAAVLHQLRLDFVTVQQNVSAGQAPAG